MMDSASDRLRLQVTTTTPRVAALVGLDGEEREQLELLLELLGWRVCSAATGESSGRDGAALIFVDKTVAARFADCSEMVVVVGGQRHDVGKWIKAKSMVWLTRPLDLRMAERLIEAACIN